MLPYLAFSFQAYRDPTIQATTLPIRICQTQKANKAHHSPPSPSSASNPPLSKSATGRNLINPECAFLITAKYLPSPH
jgi:hypothetical protein